MRESLVRLRDLAPAIAAGVALGYGGLLAALFIAHHWILRADGTPLPADFLSFWTAGGLAAQGQAPAAYDWARMHVLQRQMMGGFDGYLGWAYPPLFFAVAILLAALPYVLAYLLWVAAGLAAYAFLIARIGGDRRAALFALAAPLTLAAAMPGQNGFLTALLAGGSLLLLEERPWLAGILVGLLSYKPQFGLLFPIALLAGGHWRVAAMAAGTVLLVLLLGQVIWPGALAAFLAHMQGMRADFLTGGVAGFGKLQSLYGALRWLGAPDGPAFAAQILLLLAAGVWIWRLWRSDASASVKAAGLCAGALLATPYVFLYDFPPLAVAAAFLYRDKAFDGRETGLLLLACGAMLLFFFAPMPSGFLAVLMMMGIIARRQAAGAVARGYRPA